MGFPAAVLAALSAVAAAYLLGHEGIGFRAADPSFSQLTCPTAAHLQRAFLTGRQDHRLQHGVVGTLRALTVRPDFPGAVRLALKNAHLLAISRRESWPSSRPRFNNHSLFGGRAGCPWREPRRARSATTSAKPTGLRTEPPWRDPRRRREDTLEFPPGRFSRRPAAI